MRKILSIGLSLFMLAACCFGALPGVGRNRNRRTDAYAARFHCRKRGLLDFAAGNDQRKCG